MLKSQDSKHKGEIDVLSFSQSFQSRECPQITMTKRVDKASPALAEAVNSRKPIPSATLVVRKSTSKDQQEYTKLTMSYLTVLSSDQYLSSESRQEDITFGARSITISYKPISDSGGMAKEVVKTINCLTGSNR